PGHPIPANHHLTPARHRRPHRRRLHGHRRTVLPRPPPHLDPPPPPRHAHQQSTTQITAAGFRLRESRGPKAVNGQILCHLLTTLSGTVRGGIQRDTLSRVPNSVAN